jgi:hypothetical protein
MPYDWSYCSGNTQATSIYQVYPGWGSHRVTRCLADPEAVADMAACTFALLFVYILSGWKGSASDSQIYNYAHGLDFAVPLGTYYLADAGFPLCDSLMIPYRGVQYHLKEWGTSKQR